MILSFTRRKLNDISISKKLYFTVGIMAALVILELFTLYFAVSTLSAVRSFVNGESMWSKAEKDAVSALNQYARYHNEKDYIAFNRFLKVSQGDRNARLTLLNQHPDLKKARFELLEGRNHPDDIDEMINLVLRFHQVYYINKAFTLWAEAEPLIIQLKQISDDLHAKIKNGASQKEIDESLDNIMVINTRVTNMEDGFSSTLGEGARWLENIVLKILLTLSVTIGSTSILISISISKGIEKGIKAIIDGAGLISKGDLKSRVKVYSHDEIGALANAFNQMTDKLEENIQQIKQQEEKLIKEKERVLASEKVKQLFLMNMSHEIRTPMNVILGFAHLLEESIEDTEQRGYLSFLVRAGNELSVLLNDILKFSEMESGDVIVENLPFNLHRMMYIIMADMEVFAVQKGIQLNCIIDKNVPKLILGDKDRVSQILVKLTENAIKFTEQGEVMVLVRCINDFPERVDLEFCIKDTGIGISKKQQSSIFDQFEQISTGNERKFGGVGLGLSIVKQVVNLLDGTVSVNSKLGKGSEFHVKLSFLKSTSQKELDESPIVSVPGKPELFNISRPRVLIVDDNPLNCSLVVQILQKKGFETDIAENGKIAVFKVKNQDYDIVLMDIQMPEMGGHEASLQIKNLESDKRHIPIIAMTAHSIDGEMEKCFESGMDGFISKPFHPDSLFKKIYELLLLNKY